MWGRNGHALMGLFFFLATGRNVRAWAHESRGDSLLFLGTVLRFCAGERENVPRHNFAGTALPIGRLGKGGDLAWTQGKSEKRGERGESGGKGLERLSGSLGRGGGSAEQHRSSNGGFDLR